MDSLKRKPLQRALLRVSDHRGMRLGIFQQFECDRSDLADFPSNATSFWESDSFNRTIAADANRSAKKCVARYLARDATAVELQNDLMSGILSQIFRKLFFLLDYVEFCFSNFFFPMHSSRFLPDLVIYCNRFSRRFVEF